MEIRFLHDFHLVDLHQTFLSAFSDYLIPMNLTRAQFEQLLIRRGARNDISLAVFEDGKPVAFTINAFEDYQQAATVYDVVTGVVPEFRRSGLARRMFEFGMPRLKQLGAARYVLEVFERNEPAVKLYRGIGFDVHRRLFVFTRQDLIHLVSHTFTLKEIGPDWPLFRRFWSWQPSWQNSISCMERLESGRYIAGVFSDNELVGYGIVFTSTGDIPQFAIDPEHRRKGAGTALLHHLQSVVVDHLPVRVVNVDGAAQGTIEFMKRLGFSVLGTQNEMWMNL